MRDYDVVWVGEKVTNGSWKSEFELKSNGVEAEKFMGRKRQLKEFGRTSEEEKIHGLTSSQISIPIFSNLTNCSPVGLATPRPSSPWGLVDAHGPQTLRSTETNATHTSRSQPDPLNWPACALATLHVRDVCRSLNSSSSFGSARLWFDDSNSSKSAYLAHVSKFGINSYVFGPPRSWIWPY